MIEPGPALPLIQQSRILELSRSSLYYNSVPVSERDLELMRLIGEIHLKYPFYGSRRMRNELRDLGYDVGRGHVSTLYIQHRSGQSVHVRGVYRYPRYSRHSDQHG